MKKLRYIASIIVCSLMILCLNSCLETKHFEVDESLLEEQINDNDIQISYRMPSGFKPIKKSMVDSIASAELQYDPFAAKILAIYVDTLLNNSSAVVSDMRNVPAERTENKLDFYFTEFNPSNYWDNVEITRYKFNQFPKVVQLDMYNSNRRLIKLFFYDENKVKFSVDYVLPEEYYLDIKPFVESSIGSFNDGYTIVIEQTKQ